MGEKENKLDCSVQVTDMDSVRIWIEDQPAGQRVTVHYHTLYGNQPDANGNYIGLWPASGGTVPRRKAIWSEAVKNSSPDSSVAYLMPISEDGFIIGYCQAGDPKTDLDVSMNVSASALIDPVNSLAGRILQSWTLQAALPRLWWAIVWLNIWIVRGIGLGFGIRIRRLGSISLCMRIRCCRWTLTKAGI